LVVWAVAIGDGLAVGPWTWAPQRPQNRAAPSKLDPHLLQKGMMTESEANGPFISVAQWLSLGENKRSMSISFLTDQMQRASATFF